MATKKVSKKAAAKQKVTKKVAKTTAVKKEAVEQKPVLTPTQKDIQNFLKARENFKQEQAAFFNKKFGRA